MSSFESKVDKLDIGKLKNSVVDFSNLSHAVKYEAVKKTEQNELVKKLILFRLLMLVI